MTEQPVVRPRALASAALICFCAGGLYGWSALIPVIEQELGGTTEQSGFVFSVAIVAFTIAVIVTPRLPVVFNGLHSCVVFGCCGAAFLVLAALASSYHWFLLTFGIGYGFCSGAIYINALATAAQSARPAVITPLMVASFGMGGAVYGFIWRWFVVHGWGVLALLPLVLSLVVACVVGFAAYGRLKLVNTVKKSVPTTSGSREKPGAFILLWLSFALGSAGGLMILGLAGKMTDSVGAPASITSIAIVGVALGNTFGRLSVSGLNYTFKPINSALLAVSMTALGLVIMTLATTPWYLVVGLIIVATGYGAVASTIPALVSTIYGKDNFARVFSSVFTAWGVAGLLAPWLAGAIHDRAGDFQMAILIALLATVGSAATLLTLKWNALR